MPGMTRDMGTIFIDTPRSCSSRRVSAKRIGRSFACALCRTSCVCSTSMSITCRVAVQHTGNLSAVQWAVASVRHLGWPRMRKHHTLLWQRLRLVRGGGLKNRRQDKSSMDKVKHLYGPEAPSGEQWVTPASQ